jgi:hypothetical protein
MKANNGVLIIDDFGRQRVRPEELLNRWVVPLDRRIDFLTLAGGKKIEMPFEMLVVFASNIDPAELVDQAFCAEFKPRSKSAHAPTSNSLRSSAATPKRTQSSGKTASATTSSTSSATRPQPGTPLLLSPRHREPGPLGRPLRRQKTLPGPHLPHARRRGLLPSELLVPKGIVVAEDLLYHLPFRYEDRQNPRSLDELKSGEMASVIAEVRGSILLRTRKAPIFELTIGQGRHAIKCMWFNGTYLNGKFLLGQTVAVFGKVEASRSTSNSK